MDPIVKKRAIIAAVLFGLVVVVVIIFAVIQQVQQSSNNSQQPKTTTYNDPYSGETLTQTEGKQGETRSVTGPTFLGASKLLQYGVPSNQIEQLKYVISQYSLKRSLQKESKITETSVDVSTYRQFNADGAATGVAFAVIFNRDSTLRYYVQIISMTISQFRIIITAADQKTVVYDTEVDKVSNKNY